MTLQGLPDFHQPLRAEGLQIFYPYEGGNHILVPDRLDIAERNEGRPDFSLEVFRPRNPMLPPAPYGVVDFRVCSHYPMQDALKFLREYHSNATLTSAIFSSGFLRLLPTGNPDEIPAELLKPVAVGWNGLGISRFILKLSLNNALLLKGSLEGKIMPLLAAAELEIEGVSPRLPIRVRFNPAKLLSALVGLGNKQRQVERDKIVEFFRKNARSVMEVMGDIEGSKVDEFAETITDRIRVRFGTFVPSPEDAAKPYLALASPEEIGSGTFEWDLSEPLLVPRPLVLNLDPFAAARQLVQEQGLGAMFRETEVASVATGVFPVLVSANLPSERSGVLSLGVTVRVGPRPPQRPQAIVTSTELKPPQDSATLFLRLSPTEKLEYKYSTFVVVKDAQGIERLNGSEIVRSGDKLDLSVEEFAVDFVAVEASQALLNLASIRGILRYPEGQLVVEQSFELNLERPTLALVLPKGTEGATLEIEARSLDGSKTLKLGPLPAKDLQLDLFSFSEYGPHKIEIECQFSDDTKSFAIALLPEGRPETSQEMTVLNFTPSKPKREWTWFASSPFQAGYRYREYRSSGPTPEWSDMRSPFERLELQIGKNLGGQV